MKRREVLEEATTCVCGGRESDHGTPENNFKFIAELWTAYTGHKFTPADVAMMMALLKISRIKTGGKRADSFVDLAGYAACACELETELSEPEEVKTDARPEHVPPRCNAVQYPSGRG